MKSRAWIATLSLVACLAASAAEGPASCPGPADLRRLRDRLDVHRDRASAWVHLTWFDEARRELIEADRIYRAMTLLVAGTTREETEAAVQQATGIVWNLSDELHLLALRKQAHETAVKTFGLPANTLGHIVIAPYEKVDKPLWYVIYTVLPPSLKRETVADPREYSEHIPDSRSYVATYSAKGKASDMRGLTFEKAREAAVPEGWTPLDVCANHGATLLVRTTSHVAMTSTSNDPIGAIILSEGRIAELAEGPFAGPVVVPGSGENRIDALATDPLVTGLHALRNTEKGAVIAGYTHGGRHCDERVTFEGKNIVEIARQTLKDSAPAWDIVYSAAVEKPLNHEQVTLLGRYYGLRHELAQRRVAINPISYLDPKKMDFVRERQWVLSYGWGHLEIAGGVRNIALDERGRLLSIDETISPK